MAEETVAMGVVDMVEILVLEIPTAEISILKGMRLATTRAQLLDLTTLATGVAAAPTVAILNSALRTID
ncbi:hypothetical protein GBA52_004558 [Prunus armeniaca]|nr:hypothetical protein GBA52_004558 [Prunus armeniaca]